MDWAVAIEGRTGPESVLMLFTDRSEAEAVATEMRRSNRPAVCVRPFHRARQDFSSFSPPPAAAEPPPGEPPAG
jgi:hypothetical protein